MMIKEMLLLRGVPGSGKTDFVTTLLSLSHKGSAKAVAADDFMVDGEGNYAFNPDKLGEAHAKCALAVTRMAEDGISLIIVHNTFTRKWEMDVYFDIAKMHGYKIRTLVVENRHGGKNTHGVPDETLKNMVDRFDLKLI